MPKTKVVKASTFGGPNDSMNEGTATGVSDSHPGIALPDSSMVGGYALVDDLHGHQHVEKIIDFGPNTKTTGRGIDVGYGSRSHFPGFKTDQKMRYTYLGKDRTRALLKARLLKGGTVAKTLEKAATPATAVDPNRRALLASYLSQRGAPDALLSLGQALSS